MAEQRLCNTVIQMPLGSMAANAIPVNVSAACGKARQVTTSIVSQSAPGLKIVNIDLLYSVSIVIY